MFSLVCSAPTKMATLSPAAMSSMLRLSGSFALRGLARAAAAQRKGASAAMATTATATSTAPSSMHRLFSSLFALPGFVSCYSGVAFVPGTDSDPEYSLKVSTTLGRKREGQSFSVFTGLIHRSVERRQRDGSAAPLHSTSSLLFLFFNNNKTLPQDYDVDALLASQQRPLAAAVLFKTFWK